MEEDLVFVSQHLSIFNVKLESEECLSPPCSRCSNLDRILNTVESEQQHVLASIYVCYGSSVKHNTGVVQDRQVPFSAIFSSKN